MKKGLFAVLTAAMVLSLSTMTAFAASPTVGTTGSPVATQKATTSIAAVVSAEAFAASTTATEEYEITAVPEATVSSATVAAQTELLNDLASTGEKLGKDVLKKAAKDPSMRVQATLRSVVGVTPVTAQRNAAGKYAVTLKNAYVKADTIVAVLHYTGAAWETIAPTAVENGSVSFESADLSPIAIVELSVNGTVKSPKTGETLPVAMMVVLLGVAGAAVCGKKLFA